MATLSGSYLPTSAMQTFSANLVTCRRKVSINAMSQKFFSYTAYCPRQTNNGHYFLPTIFRNIKAKRSTFFTSCPIDLKKSSSLQTLISYMIIYKTILQKTPAWGKGREAIQPKVIWQTKKSELDFFSFDWILSESFVFSWCSFYVNF